MRVLMSAQDVKFALDYMIDKRHVINFFIESAFNYSDSEN